jgi:phosphoribosylanthranilate isomerase
MPDTRRRSLIRRAQSRPVVKICGNLYFEDSLMVASHAPDLMGWIFSPHSKRRISIESARRQIESIRRQRPGIFHVAVFAGNTIPDILSVIQNIPWLDFVQTSDGAGMIGELRSILRGEIDLIPALRVAEKIADPDLSLYMPADWCILDTLVPGSYGGTGKPLDLSWVSHVTRRHFLAGGLTPENVVARLGACNASGADVSSGVERESGLRTGPGHKDPEKVGRFIQAVKSVQFSR